MARIETVFISYRRTNASWALAIFQNLTSHGYDVFLITRVSPVVTSESEAHAQLDAPRIKCGSVAERLTGSVSVVAA